MTKDQISHFQLDRQYTGEDAVVAMQETEHPSAESQFTEKLKQREALFTALLEQKGFEGFLDEVHTALKEKKSLKSHETTAKSVLKSASNDSSSAQKGSWWSKWFSWDFSHLSMLGAVGVCGLFLWMSPVQKAEFSLKKPVPAKQLSTSQKSQQSNTRKRPQKPLARQKLGPFNKNPKSGLDFRMLLYRKGFVNSRWLRPNEPLFPGDFVQFSYRSFHIHQALVLGINQKGEIYDVLPGRPRVSFSILPEKARLPATRALELDDYKGEECFVMVYAQTPFTFQEVASVLTRAFLRAKGHLKDLYIERSDWSFQKICIQKKAQVKKATEPVTSRPSKKQ